MLIIGCDFHSRFQQVAMVDTETGELIERRLVDCRRVTITSCYASKLVWRPAAKSPLPGNSVSN
jgi:hypothetical protein